MSILQVRRTQLQQPQTALQLDRSNRFAASAQAILSAGQDFNHVTGVPLTRGGAVYSKVHKPAGQAWAFRKNFYLETEVLPAIGTQSYLEFWLGYPSADLFASGSNSFDPGFLTGSNTNQIGIFGSQGRRVGDGFGTTNQWGAVNDWNAAASESQPTSGEILVPGELTLLGAMRRQTGMEFWRNGRFVSVANFPTMPSKGAASLICGSFIRDASYWSSSSDTVSAGRIVFKVEPTAAELRAFFENIWVMFRGRPLRMTSSAATPVDTSLSGAAGSVASAYGALTSAIPLVGSAQAAAVDTGALSTSIRLSGAALAQAKVTGALLTSIPLAGTAVATATATGALASDGAGLSGAAVASATANGSLSTAIRLAGSAQAQASAAGALASSAAGLSGAALAEAGATGALSTSIRLAGSAFAQVAGAGGLSTQIRLAGTALVAASASGSLGGGLIVLSGAATASASASGALTTAVTLSGAAQARASASAQLGGEGFALSGAAVVLASASGVLTTSIRLAGVARTAAIASGELTADMRYARAPSGGGYRPHQHYNERRPAAIQRNNR